MHSGTAGRGIGPSESAEDSVRRSPRRIPLGLGIAGMAALIVIPAAVVLYLGIVTARQNTFQMLEGQAAQYLDSAVGRVSAQSETGRDAILLCRRFDRLGTDRPLEYQGILRVPARRAGKPAAGP